CAPGDGAAACGGVIFFEAPAVSRSGRPPPPPPSESSPPHRCSTRLFMGFRSWRPSRVSLAGRLPTALAGGEAMKRKLLTRTVPLMTVLSVLPDAAAMAQIPQLPVPQIVRADADSTLTQLSIDGIHFGTGLPKVTLAGTALTVLTHTDTHIVAMLPSGGVDPASYSLVVATQIAGSTIMMPSPPFDVTIGAVGPQGLKGDKGD